MNILLFKRHKNILAFTLAEVLIVIGIIGIVANMTIPTLINNVNKKQYVTALKKNQTVFMQAFMNYETQNGCIGDLSKCGDFSTGTDLAWKAFSPFLRINKDCGTTYYGCLPQTTYQCLNKTLTSTIRFDNNASFAKGVLADGTMVFMSFNGPCINSTSYCASIYIDVNGNKPPNQRGRDLFYWDIRADKLLIPSGNGTASDCDPNGDVSSGYGNGCTRRVLLEDAMNY